MKKERLDIQGIPAILFGEPSDKVFLYVHGQSGNKEEAEAFARRACQCSWQVLSIDLPGHGERKGEDEQFYPWYVVPELSSVMTYVRTRWKEVNLFANSIGAWFSMLAFKDEELAKCLFVSPILDMPRLISNMMTWAGVSEERLKEELVIATGFGQPLSWEYLQYARNNPVSGLSDHIFILYGEKDNLTEPDVVKGFTERFGCELTIMEEGEHWFHTDEQLEALDAWTENCLG
jgi:pimeloyl-ACP methyl ester carboxylesterase